MGRGGLLRGGDPLAAVALGQATLLALCLDLALRLVRGELLPVESLRFLAKDGPGAVQLPDRAALDEALIGVEGACGGLLLFRLAPRLARCFLLVRVVDQESRGAVEVLVVETAMVLLGDDLPEPRFFGVERCDARGLGGSGGVEDLDEGGSGGENGHGNSGQEW